MARKQTAGMVSYPRKVLEPRLAGRCSTGRVAWKRWRESGQEQLERAVPKWDGQSGREGKGNGENRTAEGDSLETHARNSLLGGGGESPEGRQAGQSGLSLKRW